jgi:membrane protein implicated in regulation of membrane protease activity
MSSLILSIVFLSWFVSKTGPFAKNDVSLLELVEVLISLIIVLLASFLLVIYVERFLY